MTTVLDLPLTRHKLDHTTSGPVRRMPARPAGVRHGIKRLLAKVRASVLWTAPRHTDTLDRHMLTDIGVTPDDPRLQSFTEIRRRTMQI